MVAGKHKSRSMRRIFTRTISKTKKVYKRKTPKIAHCAECKKKLKGIPRLTANKAKNLAKTKKRPQRPFGGVLCSKCMRIKIKEENLED